MASVRLSVVIPAYNEAAVIGQTLRAIATHLTTAGVAHEILVVDDGSTDQTSQVVLDVAKTLPAIRVVRSAHRGKGAAVRQGVFEAQGEEVLFMDADHSTRIEEWQKCWPWLHDGYEMVIGSRKMSGAMVTVHQPRLRELMGKGFTWLTNTLLAIRVTDITCGFKGFQASAAREMFQLQRIEGWGFDAEVLFIARRLGYRIKEVPVVWTNDTRTKVRLLKDTVRSFRELLKICLGAWRGWYPRQPVRTPPEQARSPR